MESNFQFLFKLTFIETKQLFLNISFKFKNENITLSLPSVMQFIYENEKTIPENYNNFLFSLAKLIKKFKLDQQTYYGITDDEEMAIFFQDALKNNIPLLWQTDHEQIECNFSEILPIEIFVNQKGNSIKTNINFNSAPIIDGQYFLIFRSDNSSILFMNGIFRFISIDLEDFLLEHNEKESLHYSKTEEILHLFNNIYKPNKQLLNWTMRVNIEDLLPKEIPPIPILTLHYTDNVLSPQLTYRYDAEVINPESKELEILNRVTGEKMNRMIDLETIFQKDLMDLFEKEDLPFLLTNPGDISLFLTKIIDTLKQREWEIVSHVSEFNVHKDPISLDFNINSSGQDWFSFEPNCTIKGQTVPLHEIARLMVENQGYVKTKKGFVKLSKKTQTEVGLLAKMGAFKVGKTFDKKEISVLANFSNIKSQSNDTQDLIDKAKGFQKDKVLSLNKLNGNLRSYQEHGVHWMNFLSHMGTGGVLADDMGLGKTVQTLAFSSQLEEDGPVLVICPTTVTYNWNNEIKKFLPSKSSIVYAGSQRHKHLESLLSYDFIIVSYGIIKNDLDWLKGIQFKAIFVDEAQYMKNPQSLISKSIKQLNSNFKLAMTGTPIENHLQDIWNLFDFVMPNYLGSKKEFELALDIGNKDILKARMKPFILRREKKEVLDSLPEKTEIIIKCPLSDAQMSIYKTVLDATKKGILKAKQSKNKLHMLTALLKLRQACTHPELIEECKGSGIGSAKFDLLKDKCAELIQENHKVVIFSQFTSMLDIIQDWVVSENIHYERIDGSVTGKNRINAVDRFQNSSKPTLFLISLKAGGVGINLTAADYVIHVDPWWNPAIESQATDRVHRMGQKNKVIVYKLISEDTIEEKIQLLQNEKRQLLTEIVDIDDQESNTLDFERIEQFILA